MTRQRRKRRILSNRLIQEAKRTNLPTNTSYSFVPEEVLWLACRVAITDELSRRQRYQATRFLMRLLGVYDEPEQEKPKHVPPMATPVLTDDDDPYVQFFARRGIRI